MRTMNSANPANSGTYSQVKVDMLLENQKICIATKEISIPPTAKTKSTAVSVSFQLLKKVNTDQILISCNRLSGGTAWTQMVWRIADITIDSDNVLTVGWSFWNNDNNLDSQTMTYRISIIY
jgi:hypothetical protein